MEQSRERSGALPTPQCSSYWKGSLQVALDYSRQLYLLTIMIRSNLKPYNCVQIACVRLEILKPFN